MQQELFHGLPAHRLTLTNGDSVVVAEQGAQVLSWMSAGRERLYLSLANAFDGHTALRGGVPVCFPQFNMRGHLPKHGFVRNLPWLLRPHESSPHSLRFSLQNNQASHEHWDAAFEAQLTVSLAPKQLRITLAVKNTGAQAWAFTGALHTYLAVRDIGQISLEGLAGQAEWDSLTDVHGQGSSPIRIHSEFDRVYQAPTDAICLRDQDQALQISQSASWANTVVWNPGPQKVMADMPAGDHARMLCVEAAQVFEPIAVRPGERWQGWQQLDVLA